MVTNKSTASVWLLTQVVRSMLVLVPVQPGPSLVPGATDGFRT